MPDAPQKKSQLTIDEKRREALNNDLKYGVGKEEEDSQQSADISSAKAEARMQDDDKSRLLHWEIKHHEEDLEDQRSARRMREEYIQSVRRMREKFANLAFNYLKRYSECCLFLLFCEGISLPCVNFIHFNLSDNVLLALVGSTALSVLGLVGVVLSGLFNKKK